jgi:hypothetical protein
MMAGYRRIFLIWDFPIIVASGEGKAFITRAARLEGWWFKRQQNIPFTSSALRDKGVLFVEL